MKLSYENRAFSVIKNTDEVDNLQSKNTNNTSVECQSVGAF